MPRIGVADDKVAQYAGLHYYTDKELQVQSESACRLACEIENEFLCRSFLYRGAPQGSAYNCQLFHLDHWTLPDGPSAYLNAERPLIDNGERVGTYFENYCESKSFDNFDEILFTMDAENIDIRFQRARDLRRRCQLTSLPPRTQTPRDLIATKLVPVTMVGTFDVSRVREVVSGDFLG